MKKQHHWVTRLAFTFLLGVSAASQASAAFVASDSSFGGNTLILDTQTGIEWLKLDATLGLSYDTVASQLDAGELFGGFNVASVAQVTTLFKDAGVWAPLLPLTSPSALAAGASFVDYFGGNIVSGGVVLEGMTSTAFGPFGYAHQSVGFSYQTGVSTSSWDDAYHAGSTPGVGTWLARSAAVAPVPEPATYVLMLGGLAAVCAVSLRRRRHAY